MTDVTEVERLRRRVAELEEQLGATGPPPPATVTGRRSRWWAVTSAVLVSLACVLAPLSVVAVWASAQISDTEQYVATVAPLAEDPAVQSAVADEVTATILTELDVQGLTSDALEVIAAQDNVPPRVADALPALAVPIANGFAGFTRTQVGNVLASPEFANVWAQVNRAAHTQVVKLLEGNQGGAVSAQGDTVTLNLGPVIDQVKQRLVAQGFDLAANIPSVDRSFVLVQSDAVTRAQTGYRLLNTLGVWLPLVTLALFVAGVLMAGDRRRALVRGSLGVVAAMLLLGVGLALLRLTYVNETPADVLTEAAAGQVFDTLVAFLRTGLRAVALLGLLVALAAFLSGPSSAATRTRAAFERGIGSLRGGAESAGWDSGVVGAWTYAHKRGLRLGVFLAAGLLLVFWTRPTGWVVAWTALGVVLALVVVEFLGRPPRQPAGLRETDEFETPTATLPAVPRQVPRAPSEDAAGEPVAGDSSRRTTETQSPAP
jgi:hypothetical protein